MSNAVVVAAKEVVPEFMEERERHTAFTSSLCDRYLSFYTVVGSVDAAIAPGTIRHDHNRETVIKR